MLVNCFREEIVRGVDGDKFTTMLGNRGRYLKLYIESLRLEG
jgi:hypothetical protein